jgi:hypothetical protein
MFLIAAIIRYRQIKNLPIVHDIPESLELPPSFVIKKKLSFFLSGMCVV